MKRHHSELVGELLELYREVDEAYGGYRCSCAEDAPPASEPCEPRCCHFDVTGREPYVTSIEVEALIGAAPESPTPKRRLELAPRGTPAPATSRTSPGRPCPLLVAGRCSRYAVRPLGCRSYFCATAEVSDRVPHRRLLDFVRRVKDLASRHRHDPLGRPLSRALTAERRRRRHRSSSDGA
jgi:Fe-S-cluster containining protein